MMTPENEAQFEAIKNYRLPEMRTAFADIVGEATRAVNKKYLLRRIKEALEAQPKRPETQPDELPKLTKLSIEQLRVQYLQEVGRETGSVNRDYLIWKIRQARKGRITVGPVQPGTRSVLQDGRHQTIPLRLQQTIVTDLDAARQRLRLKSRHELVRRALADYLHARGESDLAQKLCPDRLKNIEDIEPINEDDFAETCDVKAVNLLSVT